MKRLLLAGAIALIPCQVFAQTPGRAAADAGLATPTGHEVSVGVAGYNYIEPGDLRISIHGAKFVGEYAGTFLLNPRQHWFARANARATIGSTTYDGWCAPWLIVPDSTSPNGYALDLGDYSPCNESGDKDWYLEGRALVGKDFIGQRWTWSPESGLGVRHLSNGIAGVAGFRTDNYLYLPLGITARTRVASAQHAELQPGIRPSDPWLANDSQLATGRWWRSSDDDRARFHDRGLDRHLVRTARRMGVARKCEVSVEQGLVGGALLHPMEHRRFAGEFRDRNVYGQWHHSQGAARRL